MIEESVTQDTNTRLGDVQSLIFEGVIENEISVIVGGKKYIAKIKTLMGEELAESFRAVSLDDDVTKLQSMKFEVLGRSVLAINNIPVEKLYKKKEGDPESPSDVQKRILYFAHLQNAVSDKFYAAYNTIMSESRKNIDKISEEDLKN